MTLDAPDSLELRRNDDVSQATDTGFSNIHMEKDDTDDNYVRLAVKGGSTLTAGEVLTATVTGSANASCATGGPDGPTLEWKVTIGTPDTWVVRDVSSRDSDEADDDFTSTGLNAAGTATDTGLSFYRAVSGYSSNTGCTEYSLELSDGSNAIFGLRSYRANGTPFSQGLAQTVSETFASNTSARVFFRTGYAHTGGTLMVSLVAKGTGSDCGNAKPWPLTLNWLVTVHAPAAWETPRRGHAAADGQLQGGGPGGFQCGGGDGGADPAQLVGVQQQRT